MLLTVSKPPSACHLNSPIVSLHPPTCLRHLKLFSAFSIVLLSYMNDNDTIFLKVPEARTQVYLVFSESYELRAEVEVAGGKC